ncbi:xylulokinase, partial [Pseudomonas aeruginosa]
MTPEGRMHGLFLGIDCGTQGSKALLLDAGSGRTLGLGSAAQRPPEGRDGRREQDPADWLEAMASAVRMALEEAAVDGREVRALAVSAQQHGLLLLDAEGRALRPAKLWCDTESAAENRELLEALGGPAGSLERLGLVLAPGYTLSKLLWSRRRFPELFARVAHILLPHDYLNHWLTGRVCSEAGDASGSGYFDVRRRTWASDVLELVEPGGRLAAALPELIEPGACIGNLRPEAAAALGLAPHTRVACGGGDNMLAAIGTGNIRPGLLTASLGTSGTLAAYAERPLVSPHGELATFCASSGGWLPLACTMNLTGACGLVQDLLHLDLDEFSRLAAQAPVGAEGLLMLPFFDGERVPALPHASASLHGMTAANLSRANLCRAVLEGTAFGLRYGLDLLRASGLPGE